MGTEVESKMYLPGYYSMKDISNSTAGYNGWSLHPESNLLKNGQQYGIYLSKPIMDGVDYDVFDKEKLRQTIMKHESIFRQQVHELHRLYKIQRELMNDIKRKEQVNHLMPIGASHSSPFLSGLPSEDDKRSWFFSSFPLVSSNYGRPSSSSANVSQSPQSFTKEKIMQSRCNLAINESLDLMCQKPRRLLFDLELPANEYMNDETEEQGEFVVSKTESHLLNKSTNGEKTLSNQTFARRTHNLADLNEPIDVEEVSASASIDNLGNEISGGISTVHLKTERNENECSSYTFEAGNLRSKSSLSRTFHLEGFPNQCDSSRVESSRASELATCLPFDHNATGKQVKRKIFGVEVYGGNNDSSAFASKAINVANSEASTISSWTKPQSCFNRNLISVQVDPGNNTSAEHCADGYVWDRSCKNYTKVVSDVKTPDKYDAIYKENGVSVDEPRKLEMQQGGLSWLRTLPVVNGKSLKDEKEGSYKMKIDSTQIDLRKDPSQSPVQDSWSTTHGHDAERRRFETSNHASVKRILGFPIFESKTGSVASVPGNNSLLNSELAKGDLPGDPVLPSSGEQLKVQEPRKRLVNDNSYIRHQIDLNECVIEEEAQPTPPSPVVKRTTGIDLEAPVVVESDLEEDSLESKLKKPFDSFGYEPDLPCESLGKIAAEALVAISSFHVQNLQDNAALDLQENETQRQSDSSPSDFLHWFAEIISSYHENSENEAGMAKTGACHEESSSDDVDDFVYMTLNLPETKVEECCYKPPQSEDLKEEETVAPRRPRRGQARRGRQRKDFQRDVLPGLVSLSRNEVTEDLQTIEGMVKAIGGTWQSSLALRNGGKSGGGRGRRRTTCSAPPPPPPPPPPPAPAVCYAQAQQPPNSKEPGLDETSLTGWGKRTRRPPRQRCPISNSLLPLK